MTEPVFEWLSGRGTFTLCPFEHVFFPDAPEASRVARGFGRVLLSASDDAALLSRLGRVTDESARRAALKLAESQGDPVLIAELAGFREDGEAVYRSVGRVVTAKADPLSPEQFEQWVARLSRRLEVIADQEAAHITREAFEWLDFDFDDIDTGDTWRRARAGMAGRFRVGPRGTMVRAQQIVMNRVLSSVLRRTSGATARQPALRRTIGAAFNLPDRRIAEAMTRHHGFWVRDQYGRVAQGLARQAKPIITQGIRDGLGRREIGRMLRESMRGGLKMPGYWNTVAANAVNRARSYAQGATMQAAGISYYRIEAILDEATTEQCLMLHDRVLPVDDAMRRQRRILADPNPESVLWNQPFMTQDGDDLVIDHPEGHDPPRTVVAQVTSPGAGTGTPGTYSNVIGGRQMVDAAVGFPPYHHNCRTTLISEVGAP